jgi:hypothetical protein
MSSATARKPLSSIKPLKLELWSSGACVARAGIIVVDDDLPELIMVNGIPFLRDITIGALAYRRVQPYCIAAGE